MRKPAFKLLLDSTCIPHISKRYLDYVTDHIFESGRGGGGTEVAMPESPVNPSIIFESGRGRGGTSVAIPGPLSPRSHTGSLTSEEWTHPLQCLSHL